MEQNRKTDPPKLNRIKKLQTIRELFCGVIREGTAAEIKLFYRWFQLDLENPVWPVLKGPFLGMAVSTSIEPVFALQKREATDIFHAVLSLKPNMNATDVKNDRMTALHYAALSNKIMPAAMFLYYGCDPEARTKTNDRAFDKTISESMRQMFRDFDQLDRQAFAIKYALQVPKGEREFANGTEFPFSDLPLELQHEVLLKLDPVDFFNAPLVCKNWKYWMSRRLIRFMPKLGKWTIQNDDSVRVILSIEVFPTLFHFCLADNRSYTQVYNGWVRQRMEQYSRSWKGLHSPTDPNDKNNRSNSIVCGKYSSSRIIQYTCGQTITGTTQCSLNCQTMRVLVSNGLDLSGITKTLKLGLRSLN